MHTIAVPCFLPSLQDVMNDAALYVGVDETAFTKSAVSCALFHIWRPGHARSMHLELPNTTVYTNMPIVDAVGLY